MEDEQNIHIRCKVKWLINFTDGRCVFSATDTATCQDVVVVGRSYKVSSGELLDVEGQWTEHKKYGRQFEAVSWFDIRPETLEGIEKYLASGRIKGIGTRYAHAIVECYGHRAFEVLENFPYQVATDIPRFGRKRAEKVSELMKQKSLERDVMIFLASYGISYVFVKKIIKAFGADAVQTVSNDPYCLIEHISGISFASADKIAKSMHYADDDPRRLNAGVVFVMNELIHGGDCYITYENLLRSAGDILHAEEGKIVSAVKNNLKSRKLVKEGDRVYPAELYDAEVYCASKVVAMLESEDWSDRDSSLVEKAVSYVQEKRHMSYDITQKEAIYEALQNPVMILTGGPGTGKTTVLEGILYALKLCKYDIAVSAPTGRAAKRAKETTGYDATTIHRLLKWSAETGAFTYDESNTLDYDVVVVDEFSMVDLQLFEYLLRAMPLGSRLVIVGDVDQLPSVGPGNVLKDLIDSDIIPTCRLTEIHRQSKTSRIAVAARDIKNARMPSLNNRGSESFFFLEMEEKRTDGENKDQKVSDTILSLVSERLPKAYGISTSDIQVLTPQRQRSLTSSNNLNKALQKKLNPDGKFLQYGEHIFRERDIVMQMKNDYGLEVFNGDVGRIVMVNDEEDYLLVEYPDKKEPVLYGIDDLDMLSLSYATTIHKSQGSEYNTVIIPIMNSDYMMLQRNLIYTAVTRAKERCIIIGSKQALNAAITNRYVMNRRLFVERQTYLKQRIQSLTK